MQIVFQCSFFLTLIHQSLLSEWTARELRKNINPADLTAFFALIKKKIRKISYDSKDVSQAKRLKPDHFQDALHAILAKRAGAQYLITRNTSDFQSLQHLIDTKIPEKL